MTTADMLLRQLRFQSVDTDWLPWVLGGIVSGLVFVGMVA